MTAYNFDLGRFGSNAQQTDRSISELYERAQELTRDIFGRPTQDELEDAIVDLRDIFYRSIEDKFIDYPQFACTMYLNNDEHCYHYFQLHHIGKDPASLNDPALYFFDYHAFDGSFARDPAYTKIKTTTFRPRGFPHLELMHVAKKMKPSRYADQYAVSRHGM